MFILIKSQVLHGSPLSNKCYWTLDIIGSGSNCPVERMVALINDIQVQFNVKSSHPNLRVCTCECVHMCVSEI